MIVPYSKNRFKSTRFIKVYFILILLKVYKTRMPKYFAVFTRLLIRLFTRLDLSFSKPIVRIHFTAKYQMKFQNLVAELFSYVILTKLIFSEMIFRLQISHFY